MPKLDPKAIHQELEKGRIWPIIVLHGSETFKINELKTRIQRAYLADQSGWSSEIRLDGAEANVAQIVEEAQSLSFGSTQKWIVVNDAHLLKDAEGLSVLLGPPGTVDEVPFVVLLIQKDLDQRKKWTKKLIESAAVVSCEEVPENERDSWIQYLSKRKGIVLESEEALALRQLDPFNLMIVERELEKIELLKDSSDRQAGILVSSVNTNADLWLKAFFRRVRADALVQAQNLASSPEEALPALGLMAWNVRQISVLKAGASAAEIKLPSFAVDRLRVLGESWTVQELATLNHLLQEIDLSLKQSPKLPLGLWTDLVLRFT